MKKIKAIEVCEYSIWCPECGDKSATWRVDNPTPKSIKDSFKQMYEKLTYPTHGEHGPFTFIEERHYPASPELIKELVGDA